MPGGNKQPLLSVTHPKKRDIREEDVYHHSYKRSTENQPYYLNMTEMVRWERERKQKKKRVFKTED